MDIPIFLASINTAVTAYKTAVKTLDDAKIVAATNELQIQLMHVGAEIFAMQKDGVQASERERAALGRVHDLENKVRELEERASEKARYELVEDYPGTITYRVKEVARNGEPVHYLCPGCLDNQAVKSILQFNSRNKVIGTCHACGKAYRFRETPSVPTRRHERI